jgi:hypothetical protein
MAYLSIADTLISIAGFYSEHFLTINSMFGSVNRTSMDLNRTAKSLNTTAMCFLSIAMDLFRTAGKYSGDCRIIF